MIEFLMEYKKALGLRILVFSFIGMGWDVLMTTLQMILGNHLEKSAVMTASTWMFLVYGSIPLVVLPMEKVIQELKIPKLLDSILFLALFYGAEYSWGVLFHALEMEPWNYNWYTPTFWNPSTGYVSFHPVILLFWIIFIQVGRVLDKTLRSKFSGESVIIRGVTKEFRE